MGSKADRLVTAGEWPKLPASTARLRAPDDGLVLRTDGRNVHLAPELIQRADKSVPIASGLRTSQTIQSCEGSASRRLPRG